MQMKNNGIARLTILLAIIAASLLAAGCSTAPKIKDQAKFVNDSAAATMWFEHHVPGLSQQINNSAAYIIYPSVGQWGILIGGGQFGRGMLNLPNDRQIGWAAINTASIGLQAGVHGFKMLIVFQDEATLYRFVNGRLSGSMSGVLVVGRSGGSAKVPFKNGVAIYQGASTGLMAGINIGLDYMRYQPLTDNW